MTMVKCMQQVSVSEFKAHCLRLFAEVKSTGRSFLVTKNGDPIAIVSAVPPEVQDRTAFGSMRDSTRISGDILEPIDEAEWEALAD